jgi:hypothetical protein
MALRMQVYAGLHCQELVRQHALADDGMLPPVLPLVLYSGNHRWSPCDDLAALLRIEQVRSGREVPALLARLAEWVAQRESQPLRRTVTRWVALCLQRQFKGIKISLRSTLEEVQAMYGRTFNTYLELLEYEGIQEGIKQGLEQGLEQGLRMALRSVSGKADATEQRQVLLRLLRRDMGTLPADLVRRVEEAGVWQLKIWLQQLGAGAPAVDLFADMTAR